VTLFTSDVYAHFGVRGLAGAGFAGFYCPSNPQHAGVYKLSRGQFISGRPFLARESGLIAGSFDVCSQQFGDGAIGFIGLGSITAAAINMAGCELKWATVRISG